MKSQKIQSKAFGCNIQMIAKIDHKDFEHNSIVVEITVVILCTNVWPGEEEVLQELEEISKGSAPDPCDRPV